MENIIYDQDGWMIVDVQSKEDIERYAPEDIEKELIDDWGRVFRNGDFYIIINGNDRWFIYKDKQGNVKYYNKDFDDVEKNEFKSELEYNEFTDFNFIQKNITGYGKLYQLLTKIGRGEEVDYRSYNDYDKLIYDIYTNPKNPLLSRVIIVFDSEDDFFDMFDIDPDDRWFINVIQGYEGYEFMSGYGVVNNEWNEGYILPFLNDENRERINNLVSMIDPKIELNDEIAISTVLNDNFEEEVEGLCQDYVNEINIAGNLHCEQLIEQDFGDPFSNYGIMEQSSMYKYVTSVNILLRLMVNLFNDKDLTIFEILKRSIGKKGYSINSEISYEYPYQGDFNSERFNNDAEDWISKMEEAFEERYTDFSGYKTTYDYITSKYKIGVYNLYPLDRDKTEKRTFVIDGVDEETNKIIVSLYNPDGSKKDTRSLTIDEFNRFLTQYELFEGIKNYHTKIINEQLNNNRDKILVKQFMDTLKPTSKQEPIGNLNKMINDYNNQNPKQPTLNLETVLNTPTDSKLKIDLFGLPVPPNGTQKIITTAELKLNPTFKITLQRNPISNQTLPGVKINF